MHSDAAPRRAAAGARAVPQRTTHQPDLVLAEGEPQVALVAADVRRLDRPQRPDIAAVRLAG